MNKPPKFVYWDQINYNVHWTVELNLYTKCGSVGQKFGWGNNCWYFFPLPTNWEIVL